MRIALYIEDGLEQIVLTPETDTERGVVRKLNEVERSLSIHRGKFYECKGGWVRQGVLSVPYSESEYDSTIIVLRPTPHKGKME